MQEVLPILNDKTVLRSVEVTKTVPVSHGELSILQEVSLEIKAGEATAVLGASGSGKTTLLSLLAGLDRASSGEVWLMGNALSVLDEAARARIRRENVGFVFQNFQLLNSLTALENTILPMELQGTAQAADKGRLWLSRVGLENRANHYPGQLSGGEQQRTAIARAFASEPKILFADEPTGNLDTATGALVSDIMLELNEQLGTTLVLVTHDEALAARCSRCFKLRAGRLDADA